MTVDGLLVVFFRDKTRKPFRLQMGLPVQIPAQLEIPHEQLPFTEASIDRLLAYVLEDPQKCAVCRGKKCSACGYKPRRVSRYEQLFFPRRIQLELAAWETTPGRVTG